jgi:hypothetical protein
MRLELDLPEELWNQLGEVAAAMQLGPPREAALIGLAQWLTQRKAELDDRDPARKYFINEALDELAKKT